jgi:hypothetical protein
MQPLDVLICVLGAALAAAGVWWLWGGRWWWPPARRSRFRRAASEPTRMVIGLVHLVLGYHLIVWSLPAREHRAIQIPRQSWYWLVLGCAGAMAGSVGLDRWNAVGSNHDSPDSDT